MRQVARAQRKGLNFPVFVGEKSAFCEPLSLSELLEFNDWQNAATSCPAVPNDLLERELFYCTHRCSRARTSRLLSEVLKSEFKPCNGIPAHDDARPQRIRLPNAGAIVPPRTWPAGLNASGHCERCASALAGPDASDRGRPACPVPRAEGAPPLRTEARNTPDRPGDQIPTDPLALVLPVLRGV